MNPEDAINAFKSLEARLLCAMHWGTFKLTDEPLDEPPRLLEALRLKEEIAQDRVWVAAIGESRRR
jgi:L-ascorbate metabolism protein UlaG (beta-lactamase superfamily)